MVRRESEGRAAGMNGASRIVYVWDAPTRLFHWLVTLLVIAAYTTWRLSWISWHEIVGEALLALLLFRMLWGFLGSETARFSSFLVAPQAALEYLLRIPRREPPGRAGHNPAGGWMVLFLLILLFGETLSGLYIANDIADVGPFTEIMPASIANAIDGLHAIFWQALLAATTLHLLAVFVYVVLLRQDLVVAMITGKRFLPRGVAAPRIVSPIRAVLLIALSAAGAAALADYL